MDNIRRDSMQFSKWSESIATILSQHTSVDGYTLLRYLVKDYGAAKTWNTSDTNINYP